VAARGRGHLRSGPGLGGLRDAGSCAIAGELRRALGEIGRDEQLRARFVAACLEVEARPEHAFTNVRDELTGPIVDALHEQAGVVRKALSNGLAFDFHYRSKIARDFVLSVPETPDHVWEPQTTKLLLHLARGGSDVIVGGAYFGEHAVPIANELSAAGGVCHAFEPNVDQATMLAANARLNSLANLRVNTLGLWSDAGSRLRFVGRDALAGSEPAAADEPDSFATETVDRYLDGHGIESVALIAVDVEGAELAILQGARRRLSLPPGSAPHLVFEVHRSYVDWSEGLRSTAIARYLESLGYTLFAVRDFQSNYDLRGRPIELVPPDGAYLEGPPHGFNMLAVKDTAIVAGEPFAIAPGVSPKLLVHRDPALHHPLGGLPSP
jgi:FkbM family methyltransferase